MKYILILCITLAGCREISCVDGQLAYKQGKVWVIPNGAYRCKEAE
jgi:hypothetical protein